MYGGYRHKNNKWKKRRASEKIDWNWPLVSLASTQVSQIKIENRLRLLSAVWLKLAAAVYLLHPPSHQPSLYAPWKRKEKEKDIAFWHAHYNHYRTTTNTTYYYLLYMTAVLLLLLLLLLLRKREETLMCLREERE